MALDEDIEQVLEEQPAQKQVIWPATVASVDPLTVTLDGSGVAVPCLSFGEATLKVGRRVGVVQVGNDLAVFGGFGSDLAVPELTLEDLTVTDTTTLNNVDWAGSVSKAEGATGNVTATSTSFTSTGLGDTFVAPPSGKVNVMFGGRLYILVANGSVCLSPYVRVGASIGAGADYATPNDVYCVELGGPTALGDFVTAGHSRLIEALTPGDTYNVQMYHKASPANSGGTTKVTMTIVPVL